MCTEQYKFENIWKLKLNLFDAETGKMIKEILSKLSLNSSFSVSPDSKTIAYIRILNNNYKYENQLIIMDIDGNNEKIILTAKELEYVIWSPDGKSLLVRMADSETNSLHFSVVNIEEESVPNYSPVAIVDKDGKFFDGIYPSWQPILS